MSRSKWAALALVTVATTACSQPPETFAIYPGLSFGEMSQLEPGTGEYLLRHPQLELASVAIDIIDPTTQRAFVHIEDAAIDVSEFTDRTRTLGWVTVKTSPDVALEVARENLRAAVRAFIANGWRCFDGQYEDDLPVDETAIPEGICASYLGDGPLWYCRSPPNWPPGTAMLWTECVRRDDTSTLTWVVQMPPVFDSERRSR